ncbi:peptidoglycan endopeptidase [Apilactobacillus micheneri]|uniref:Peptidoglycan endopeptidase n=1 Tax=Apilactobacillus micheneri TaxID=1899430 RepID=A0A9Q8MTW1_9LACO|nr:peptidoglycan endopeptidase [Apilactobacillus micheneri]TPR41852.1 peptidoglycan endopeptidase [Apilactobacillus micheneri]TPR44243.1 peptidoglycan endopeptidase [Apilactobacillus micheneri]TPR45867.1 peptidoglycan endopeptidase [Apilactobacillus micheneri]TPR50611.1 peptidoglycan endopeptidase [Apilactobacillus micheneri]
MNNWRKLFTSIASALLLITLLVCFSNNNVNAKAKEYQNPKRYYQISDKQIKPVGKVGYTVKVGYEGIKTVKIMRKLGVNMGPIGTGHYEYNYASKNAVMNFQKKHHLKVTGNVDVNTWVKLGFPRWQFYSIDRYVAPLGAKITQGRKAHINAAIKQAYKYLGKPYIYGASSSPNYGNDCSGLVVQALYAGGINPKPVSAIQHAHPGNEWNSRKLWATKKFKFVPFGQRKRGDLIFYYEPGTKTIWHVALYLGNDRIIESWPPRVQVSSVYARSVHTGYVARPWDEK